jgi:hypothetical protein
MTLNGELAYLLFLILVFNKVHTFCYLSSHFNADFLPHMIDAILSLVVNWQYIVTCGKLVIFKFLLIAVTGRWFVANKPFHDKFVTDTWVNVSYTTLNTE